MTLDRLARDLREIRRRAQRETLPEVQESQQDSDPMLEDPRGTPFDQDGRPSTGGMRPPR